MTLGVVHVPQQQQHQQLALALPPPPPPYRPPLPIDRHRPHSTIALSPYRYRPPRSKQASRETPSQRSSCSPPLTLPPTPNQPRQSIPIPVTARKSIRHTDESRPRPHHRTTAMRHFRHWFFSDRPQLTTVLPSPIKRERGLVNARDILLDVPRQMSSLRMFPEELHAAAQIFACDAEEHACRQLPKARTHVRGSGQAPPPQLTIRFIVPSAATFAD